MDFAPQNVEAIAVFISSGFNSRNSIWLDIPDKKENLLSIDGLAEIPKKPWLLEHESLFEIKEKVFKKLKYFYVFSNPYDQKAYSEFETIGKAINRSLDRLNEYKIDSIAFILIPATQNPNCILSKEDETKCAAIMIETIKSWMAENREFDVFLVDRVDDFNSLV